MLINEGEAIYLGKDGKTTDEPGDGATLLVARGGRIDEATARRHGIADRLRPGSEADLRARHTGDPYVLVDGRAVAKSLVEPDSDAAPEPARPRAESKAIRQSEDKALVGPAPIAAHPAPAPAAKPAEPAKVAAKP